MRLKTDSLLTAFLISFLWISFAHAQSPMKSATPEDLIEKLNPNSNSNSAPMRTRGMRNLTPEAREKPNVDLMIQFEFDSAKLLPESKPLLDNLAKAINSDPLRGYAFVVEGHTDAVGTTQYNLKLSDQRASTVLNYLSSKGVSKERLKAIGKGSNELLQPDKPDASENRRVKITLNS
jgi:outer membrane protein OmpA-like peptidoglycan-associated protein